MEWGGGWGGWGVGVEGWGWGGTHSSSSPPCFSCCGSSCLCWGVLKECGLFLGRRKSVLSCWELSAQWTVVLSMEKEDALRREEEQTSIGNQPAQCCSGKLGCRRGLCLHVVSGNLNYFPSIASIHTMSISVSGEAPLLPSTLKRSWAFRFCPYIPITKRLPQVSWFGEIYPSVS